jgi:hypothetical protein
LDLWFREDVARILASAQETMRAATGGMALTGSETPGAYQQGFLDALRVVGIAFGVASPAPPKMVQPGEHVQVVDGESRAIQWKEKRG